MPKGYWIARVDVADAEQYQEYVRANAEPFRKYGARFLVRAGRHESPEGTSRGRNVVLEFPSYQAAIDCWNSPEYAIAADLRRRASTADILIIEGYDGPQPGEGTVAARTVLPAGTAPASASAAAADSVGATTSGAAPDLLALRDAMRAFVADRDWAQFHSPKNLAMALSVEAAELVEHFQWLTEDQSRTLEPAAREPVADELADVLLYLVRIADELGIDLRAAATAKMAKNAAKYPVEKSRGSARKYTEL